MARRKKTTPTQNAAIIFAGCVFMLLCLFVRLLFQSMGITLHWGDRRQFAVFGEVRRTAAAINADPRWFWEGPDVDTAPKPSFSWRKSARLHNLIVVERPVFFLGLTE